MSIPHSSHHQCGFLNLPWEIRNRVYEFLFFAKENNEARGLNQALSEFELRKLTWASTGLVSSVGNQIHPYRRDSKYQPKYDVSILRVNHQIQDEAERVFYGWSTFNLTSDAYAPGELPTYQFFQSLTPRYRKLISSVEIRCFYRSANGPQTGNNRLLSLFDWKIFMKFLACECPSLRSLVLWGFADGVEGWDLERSCQLRTDWVQSILQIKTLRFFDIRAIPRRNITEDQSCVPKVLHDLRSLLYQQSDKPVTTEPAESSSLSQGYTFPLLQLPLHLRKRIYRFALLPADGHLRPYLKSWYDITIRNVVPLFLTCRQVRNEAEAILYGEGLFWSPAHKYDQALTSFLHNLPPRLLDQIQHKLTYRQKLLPFIDEASARQPRPIVRYTRSPHNHDKLQRFLFIAEHPHKRWPFKRLTFATDDGESFFPHERDWITQGFMDLGPFEDGNLILRLDW